MTLSGVIIYSRLQCGHAKSQIEAVSISIDNGLLIFFLLIGFVQSFL